MATSSNSKLKATNEDRLSSLPEETLLHILSFLPIKHTIRTSILSNRWRSLWTFNPNISFSYEDDCSPTDFAHLVNNSLLRYNASTIHGLSIDNLSPEFLHDFSSYTQGWIRFATNRGVQEVILKVTETPDFLFFHTPLTKLFVTFGTFYSPPGFNHVSGFPCLKVLQLSQLQYSNITSDAVCSSLFSCHFLEKLTIRNCDVAQNLNIYSPNACLRIVELWWCRCLKKLHINAPSLVSFKYHGNESIDIYLETAQPKLVKAQVYFRDNIHPLKIRTPLLTSTANVTYLETSSWFTQFIFAEYWVAKAPHIVFNNLKEFKWFGYLGSPELLSLAAFLSDCPLLQKLHINIEYPVESECYDQHRRIVKDKKARLQQLDYSLPHLKTIQVIGFSATKQEMSMVRFLLAKTPILDLLLLKSRSAKDTKDDWADWPGRPNWPPKWRLQEHPNLQLQEQLFSLPKSSKHAQIVLSRTCPGSKREMLRWISWSPEVPNVYFSALPDD